VECSSSDWVALWERRGMVSVGVDVSKRCMMQMQQYKCSIYNSTNLFSETID